MTHILAILRVTLWIWGPCVATLIIMAIAFYPRKRKAKVVKMKEYEPLDSQLN